VHSAHPVCRTAVSLQLGSPTSFGVRGNQVNSNGVRPLGLASLIHCSFAYMRQHRLIFTFDIRSISALSYGKPTLSKYRETLPYIHRNSAVFLIIL